MVAQPHKFTKNYGTGHLQWVNRTVYKLYLNKALLKEKEMWFQSVYTGTFTVIYYDGKFRYFTEYSKKMVENSRLGKDQTWILILTQLLPRANSLLL